METTKNKQTERREKGKAHSLQKQLLKSHTLDKTALNFMHAIDLLKA